MRSALVNCDTLPFPRYRVAKLANFTHPQLLSKVNAFLQLNSRRQYFQWCKKTVRQKIISIAEI